MNRKLTKKTGLPDDVVLFELARYAIWRAGIQRMRAAVRACWKRDNLRRHSLFLVPMSPTVRRGVLNALRIIRDGGDQELWTTAIANILESTDD